MATQFDTNHYFDNYVNNIPIWKQDPDVVSGSFTNYIKNHKLSAADANEIAAWNADRANFWNAQEWQATNAWNLYTWDLQNEYNSPTAEMQRLMAAGINPIWSMSENHTPAQEIGSMTPHAANVPELSFEDRALSNDMLKFSQTNALNSLLGLGDLDVKNRNLAIQSKLSDSEIKKTQAEVALIKSQTETNQFINSINNATYGVQVNQKIADLNQTRQTIRNLESQNELTEMQSDLLKVQKEKEELLKNQVIAATRKIEQDIQNDLVRLQYEAMQLAINQQNANSATVQAGAAAQNAATNDAALHHQIEKDSKEFELKSNEQILNTLESTRSWFDKLVGHPGNVADLFSGNDGYQLNKALSSVQAGVKVLYNRFYSNPTKANAQAIENANSLINELNMKVRTTPFPLPTVTPANQSVLNPSQSWQQ